VKIFARRESADVLITFTGWRFGHLIEKLYMQVVCSCLKPKRDGSAHSSVISQLGHSENRNLSFAKTWDDLDGLDLLVSCKPCSLNKVLPPLGIWSAILQAPFHSYIKSSTSQPFRRCQSTRKRSDVFSRWDVVYQVCGGVTHVELAAVRRAGYPFQRVRRGDWLRVQTQFKFSCF
jgi:hypothetical protein